MRDGNRILEMNRWDWAVFGQIKLKMAGFWGGLEEDYLQSF